MGEKGTQYVIVVNLLPRGELGSSDAVNTGDMLCRPRPRTHPNLTLRNGHGLRSAVPFEF